MCICAFVVCIIIPLLEQSELFHACLLPNLWLPLSKFVLWLLLLIHRMVVYSCYSSGSF